VRIALLKGNRFNPWHLQGFRHLRGAPEITAFRAESEIQGYFHQRDDGSLGFNIEPIHFDTQAGNPLARLKNRFLARCGRRDPRIVPFYDRLARFDLIQTWELFTDWSAQAALARERFGVPVVVMVWDNLPFNMEQTRDLRERKRRVAAAADRFIVYTERSRRMLDIEGVAMDRVVQIPPGVDTDRFAPGPAERAAFGIGDDEFVILFVGWLLPRKGIDFLLLALRELLADPEMNRVRPRLLIVGSGPGRNRVDALVARLGLEAHCTFAGSLGYSRMPAAYRAADVFALPSIATDTWQEQFGMSLIEAMAAGLPVVASRSGAIPEIGGDAAVLCQPNDFLALYRALKGLAVDTTRRRDLASAARARAVGRFGLRRHVEALSDVYEDVLTKWDTRSAPRV